MPKASLVKSPLRIATARNQARERDSVALVLLLVVGEEECLVFANRAADRAAELIQIELFGVGSEEAARVQVRIAKKLEHRSRGIDCRPILVVTRTVGPARVPHSAE